MCAERVSPCCLGRSNNTACICYLLQQQHGQRTYVGFTACASPWRRLAQHNGELVGGAATTATGRPWRVVCFVTGFLWANVALQFERAWQRGRGLRWLRATLSKEEERRGVRGKLQVLHHLLRSFRWRPYNLCIHVVRPETAARAAEHRRFALHCLDLSAWRHVRLVSHM